MARPPVTATRLMEGERERLFQDIETCSEIIVQHISLDLRSIFLKLHGCCWWLSCASQVLRSSRPWPWWGWTCRDLRRPRAESGLPLQRRACRACVQAAQRGCLPPTSSGLKLTSCFFKIREKHQLTFFRPRIFLPRQHGVVETVQATTPMSSTR